MCDYSLNSAKSRPAAVGDKLITHNFCTGTSGFIGADDQGYGSAATAVCVLPGTEISFEKKANPFSNSDKAKYHVAIFRQINKDNERTHHDALEFPDGDVCLLTYFPAGQHATVLQLPAAPKTEQEAKEQTRLEVVG